MEETGIHESNGQSQQSPDKKQIEQIKRLNKEISPFTLADLPIGEAEDALFSSAYMYQKILGTGSYGVVVAAVEKSHLEQCAIKV